MTRPVVVVENCAWSAEIETSEPLRPWPRHSSAALARRTQREALFMSPSLSPLRRKSDGDAGLAELEMQQVAVERHHQDVSRPFEDGLAEHFGVGRFGEEEDHGRLAPR